MEGSIPSSYLAEQHVELRRYRVNEKQKSDLGHKLLGSQPIHSFGMILPSSDINGSKGLNVPLARKTECASLAISSITGDGFISAKISDHDMKSGAFNSSETKPKIHMQQAK